jgi:hypothetical protein
MISDTLLVRKGHPNPKVDANYPVVLFTADGPLEGETKNISTKEVFVRCQDPLHLWDVASLSIEVSQNDALVAEAEVVWSNKYGPDDDITPRGMVVRLRSLSYRNQKRLEHVITEQAKKNRMNSIVGRSHQSAQSISY